MTTGRHADAQTLARTALRVNPLNAQAHNLFGTILSQLNDLPAGEWHFRRALELGGEQAPFLANLALNLMQQGRTDEAETCFARAHALAPGDCSHARALVEAARGAQRPRWRMGLAGAGQARRREQRRRPVARQSPCANGQGQRSAGDPRRRAGTQRRCAARTRSPARSARALRRSMARLRRRQATAGRAKPAGSRYNAQAVETFFARLKRFFVRATSSCCRARRLRADVPQPIFIMGFPRSGTTLIEQVLASHSAVRAGGELPVRHRAAAVLAAAVRRTRAVSGELWRAPGRRTTARPPRCSATTTSRAPSSTGCSRPARRYFTDKMPFNEIWLPLVRMAFPHAKIVRVLRHPLDVCVSMLAEQHDAWLQLRLSDRGHRASSAGRHPIWTSTTRARLQLDAAPAALRVASSRNNAARRTRLLDHLGLQLEPACLSFHENRALRADAELRAGDPAAQRPFHRTPPALRRAARAVPSAARRDAGAHGYDCKRAGILRTTRGPPSSLRTSAARRRSTRGRCRRSRAAADSVPANCSVFSLVRFMRVERHRDVVEHVDHAPTHRATRAPPGSAASSGRRSRSSRSGTCTTSRALTRSFSK